MLSVAVNIVSGGVALGSVLCSVLSLDNRVVVTSCGIELIASNSSRLLVN